MTPLEREQLCELAADLEMLRNAECIVGWSLASHGGTFTLYVQCAPDVLYGATVVGTGVTPGAAYADMSSAMARAERAAAERTAGPS